MSTGEGVARERSKANGFHRVEAEVALRDPRDFINPSGGEVLAEDESNSSSSFCTGRESERDGSL